MGMRLPMSQAQAPIAKPN